MNHTVKDAVMDLLAENNIAPPKPQVDTTGADIPVIGGSIHARIYTPKNGTGPFPVIVYYHGGGWVIFNVKKDFMATDWEILNFYRWEKPLESRFFLSGSFWSVFFIDMHLKDPILPVNGS
jgi:hypothetical protein